MNLKEGEICGYPPELKKKGKVPLYHAPIVINEVEKEDWIQYNTWTSFGMSGSPVFIRDKERCLVMGIHYGQCK